jgi:hypothetical protein
MKHLSRDEFVDLIESPGALTADRMRHIGMCERCRAEAETLRQTLLIVDADDIPEPSPLFWDHFSSRVADALGDEPVPAPVRRWSPAPFATWAAVATVVVLLASTAVWRTTRHAPATRVVPTELSAAPNTVDANPVDDLDSDEAWAVVRAAADDIAWEDVHDAGISPHPDDVDNAALQLNAAERVELARLLDADLKRNGA